MATSQRSRESLIKKAGGYTELSGRTEDSDGFLQNVPADSDEAEMTRVDSCRSEDMVTLLEHEEFTLWDVQVVIRSGNGSGFTSALWLEAPMLDEMEPTEEHFQVLDEIPVAPSELPDNEYLRVIGVAGILPYPPDEAEEKLAEWGVTVDGHR